MSRFAILLVILAALACPAPSVAAIDVPEGSYLVDEGTLDPDDGPASANWQSRVLQPDVEYTVTVSGFMTERYDAAANRTYDALYCYGSGAQDTQCGKSGGAAMRVPAVKFATGPTGRTKAFDGIDTLGGMKGNIARDDYAEYSTQFHIDVVPGASDDFRLVAATLYDGYCGCEGRFTVKVYGPRLRKHGTIKFAFLQKGLPKSHTEELVESTTSGHGTLRLTDDLGGDHVAPFVPKGGVTILHTDDYKFSEGEGLILGVTGGSYHRTEKGELVVLKVEVLTSSDTECDEGSKGGIIIFEPSDAAGRDRFVQTSICGDHKHRFRPFKGQGSVHVRVRLRRAPPNARLL